MSLYPNAFFQNNEVFKNSLVKDRAVFKGLVSSSLLRQQPEPQLLLECQSHQTLQSLD